MEPDVAVVIETPPTKPTLEAIDQGLDAYNAQFSPEHFSEFAVVLKAEDGAVKGGITTIVWAGMLFIKWFWIEESLRRRGHGRALLSAAEDEGRRLGCSAVWLDTFEFQARPFYEKLGYEPFGTLDYPHGFKRFFLTKTL